MNLFENNETNGNNNNNDNGTATITATLTPEKKLAWSYAEAKNTEPTPRKMYKDPSGKEINIDDTSWYEISKDTEQTTGTTTATLQPTSGDKQTTKSERTLGPYQSSYLNKAVKVGTVCTHESLSGFPVIRLGYKISTFINNINFYKKTGRNGEIPELVKEFDTNLNRYLYTYMDRYLSYHKKAEALELDKKIECIERFCIFLVKTNNLEPTDEDLVKGSYNVYTEQYQKNWELYFESEDEWIKAFRDYTKTHPIEEIKKLVDIMDTYKEGKIDYRAEQKKQTTKDLVNSVSSSNYNQGQNYNNNNNNGQRKNWTPAGNKNYNNRQNTNGNRWAQGYRQNNNNYNRKGNRYQQQYNNDYPPLTTPIPEQQQKVNPQRYVGFDNQQQGYI